MRSSWFAIGGSCRALQPAPPAEEDEHSGEHGHHAPDDDPEHRRVRGRSIRPSTQANAALKQLILRMEAQGWKAGGTDWYAISLRRPVGRR
jgi:hypothetical protein